MEIKFTISKRLLVSIISGEVVKMLI